VKHYLAAVGDELAAAGRDRVADLLRRVLLIVPAYTKVWSRLGKENERVGDPAAAARCYLRYHISAPGSPKARNRLILLLRAHPPAAAGLPPSLLADLLGSDDIMSLVVAGTARLDGGDLDGGDLDGARRLLRRAAVTDPGFGYAWAMLALAAGLSGETQASRRLWWVAWTADPKAFAARQAWAERIAARSGTGAGALPLLTKLAGDKRRDYAGRRALIDLIAGDAGTTRVPRRRLTVDKPLVLISQIQRSGGSMILELLDDHPEVFPYPYELILGRPLKAEWPDLDLDAPAEQWMNDLFEPRLPQLSLRGYAKPDQNRFATDRLPFDFDIPGLIRRFLTSNRMRPRTQRKLLNRYFTAFFQSWSDYRPSGRERWVAAFAPRMVMHPLGMRRYRRDYPDGHLVGSVRHPRSWLISAQRHNDDYRNHANALTLWQISVETILEQHQRSPDATTVVIYEHLVSDPEAELRRLAGDLGIEYRASLLTPTLNGQPLRPNSSFDVSGTGIHRESLARDEPLRPGVDDYIEEQSMPLYREACRMVADRRAVSPLASD